MATGEERVDVLGLPGTEESGRGELASGALLGAGTAAYFSADHQGPQSPFGSIIVRGDGRVGDKGEEFLDKCLNAPAQLALYG